MTVTIIVLDSVGLGAMPDAEQFGGVGFNDVGSHTLDHILQATGVSLPNFEAFGIGNITGVNSIPRVSMPDASYGRLHEVAKGKDSTTGHWEFMGIVFDPPFRTFVNFPSEIMEPFDAFTGGHLGNLPASGTQIIQELGEKHLETGLPIVYTSADSVFQIAAHTDVVPLAKLYEWCEFARELLRGEYAVARVIARPFTGTQNNFTRLGKDRKDFSFSPPHETVLNVLEDAGKEVIGIGKIPDLYNYSGITKSIHTDSNQDGINKTIAAMKTQPDGLIFCNLVEFDSLYGHRRNTEGYAQALLETDTRLPEFRAALSSDDILMFISDHGNDPTWQGTDHTREYGLLLAYGKNANAVDLGTRQSFADVGATVAELLGVEWHGVGKSFADLLL